VISRREIAVGHDDGYRDCIVASSATNQQPIPACVPRDRPCCCCSRRSSRGQSRGSRRDARAHTRVPRQTASAVPASAPQSLAPCCNPGMASAPVRVRVICHVDGAPRRSRQGRGRRRRMEVAARPASRARPPPTSSARWDLSKPRARVCARRSSPVPHHPRTVYHPPARRPDAGGY